jgi:MFS transporter, ACS family, hexuronate transporter
MKKNFFTYENGMMLLLFLTFGLVFMDKLSFTFLLPFISKDLGLNNTQSGLALGIISLFFGLSTLLFSGISDLMGSKKKMLIVFVVLFSLVTLSVGLMKNYTSMIVIRALMGITEGPVIPLILTIVLATSSVKRRGFNMGLIKGSGPLMSGVIAPMILIPIAAAYHWKWGFYIMAVPGLVFAILLWKYLKEPVLSKEDAAVKPSITELKSVFKQRNIWLCMLMSIFYMTNLISFIGFSPLYVTNMLHYTDGQLQWFLTVFGVGCFIWFFTIPGLSDQFGRKKTLLFFTLASMALPLVMANFHMNRNVTLFALILGTCAFGYMPLFDSIIPSESVSHKYAATVMAGTVLTGEVIGGTLGPVIAGKMADIFDLRAPFYVGAIAGLIAFLLSFGIKDTTPKKIISYER